MHNNCEHYKMASNLGETMHNTFKRGNSRRISELISDLEKSFCLNALDNALTPLMCAVQLNCVTAVALLLKKPAVKAEINYTNNSNLSALAIAARFGYLDIVYFLIINGATVTEDIKDEARKGKNQAIINLLESSTVKYFGICKLLIDNGGIVTEEIKEVARKSGNQDIIPILQKLTVMAGIMASSATLMSAPITYSTTRESSCTIL